MTMRQSGKDPAGDPLLLDDVGSDRGPPAPSPLDYLRFVGGAIRRRWAIASSVFLIVVAAAALYYRFTPSSYRVEAKILAQTTRAGGDDLPARSAWELIHRRENLVSLAEQTGLGEKEAEEPGRSLLTRLLDQLRPPDVERKEAPLDVLVRTLDKRLVVSTEEGTIQLSLDWPNAHHAYQIVQGAVQSFLEARHLQEVTSIDDAIAQMEGRMATLKADLDSAIAASHRRAPVTVRTSAPRERQPSEELVRLRSTLDAKVRAIRDVEEFRSRRVAELESQLTQARATLSDAHPTVEGLKRDIEALSRESAQLRALREDERKVRADYNARLAKEGYPASPGAAAEPAVLLDTGGAREEDPRVRDLRLQYEQMASRVTSARVDLDAARAAFKYRYNVIWPPEIPTEPFSPKPLKVLGGGFVAALLLALMAAVLPDLLSGRIVERWQVDRQLGIPVLGETPSTRSSR